MIKSNKLKSLNIKYHQRYEDYVSYDEATGTGTLAQSKPAELGSPAKDWDSRLTENGIDPNYFTVLDDTMKYRTWTGMDGSKMVH